MLKMNTRVLCAQKRTKCLNYNNICIFNAAFHRCGLLIHVHVPWSLYVSVSQSVYMGAHWHKPGERSMDMAMWAYVKLL